MIYIFDYSIHVKRKCLTATTDELASRYMFQEALDLFSLNRVKGCWEFKSF